MATRCTSAEVLAIMSVADVPDGVDRTAFIEIASPYVDDIYTAGLTSDDKLKSIERYLAAHFAALRYKHSNETQIGDRNARDKFGFVLGMGFDATTYGQMAQTLDTTKTLSGTNTTKYKADFAVVEREEWDNT